MPENEPFFYDPETGLTAWKRNGQWVTVFGKVHAFQRGWCSWATASPESIARFEALHVTV